MKLPIQSAPVVRYSTTLPLNGVGISPSCIKIWGITICGKVTVEF